MSYSNGKEDELQRAPLYLRVIHHVIDLAVIYAAIQFIDAVGMSYTDDHEFPVTVLGVVSHISAYLIYFILFEVSFQATIGKLFTQTVVVDINGRKPTFGQIVGRNFARLIPFEPFSCLSNPSNGWHDDLSRTQIVLKSELERVVALKEAPSDDSDQ